VVVGEGNRSLGWEEPRHVAQAIAAMSNEALAEAAAQ
jgi:hypothetical protein